jgi:MSHA biogenesis protein MshP
MCPDPISSCRHRCVPRRAAAAQRGFSIVSAIFLLVVLSALGAFMATFSSVQHVTSALDVRGAQAYQAARTGIEWGTYRVLRNSSCAGSQALNDVPGFIVTVTCVASASYTEGVTPVTAYQITATASSGTVGGIGYVERQLQATVSR